MSPTAIFWPMIAHVALVGIVYGVLGIRRGRALRSGEAKISAFRTRGGAEPASSATASASLMNQFEVPVLLHVVCLALFVTSGVSYLSVVSCLAVRCLALRPCLAASRRQRCPTSVRCLCRRRRGACDPLDLFCAAPSGCRLTTAQRHRSMSNTATLRRSNFSAISPRTSRIARSPNTSRRQPMHRGNVGVLAVGGDPVDVVS